MSISANRRLWEKRNWMTEELSKVIANVVACKCNVQKSERKALFGWRECCQPCLKQAPPVAWRSCVRDHGWRSSKKSGSQSNLQWRSLHEEWECKGQVNECNAWKFWRQPTAENAQETHQWFDEVVRSRVVYKGLMCFRDRIQEAFYRRKWLERPCRVCS